MSYLFDTDAISETLRKRPLKMFLEWLRKIPKEEQFTSSIVIAELYKGAFKSPATEMHLLNIEDRVLKAITVLPFDNGPARVFGEKRSQVDAAGTPVDDPDLLIASTAIFHNLDLVTGNLKHFRRVPGLKICTILDRARKAT